MTIESIISYFFAAILFLLVFYFYIKKNSKRTHNTKQMIEKAKQSGLYEPVSLHPFVDLSSCIGSGACIEACPEKDVLGIMNGKAVTINAARCVGHGACFHACPMQAITLVMGTEKRGVELPHVSKKFETNIPGIYIAGELGGMGLIKNAVEQGRQAMENISAFIKKPHEAIYDVAIVGAGPAGISATLTAVKNKLKYITIDQDSLGGTVFSFPRQKIVMTSPMDLPLHGKVKFSETSKTELLTLWQNIIEKQAIKINEQEKVTDIIKTSEIFEIITSRGKYSACTVLLAIGRRGSPRKLGVKGEEKEKVFYKLLDPELINSQNILVVGGGDSAVEAALLLIEEGNNVTISYRSSSFSRLKEMNAERIQEAENNNKVKVLYNTVVNEIRDDEVILSYSDNGEDKIEMKNDLIYIFAGGELPASFLEKIGIKITKKFGEAILKH